MKANSDLPVVKGLQLLLTINFSDRLVFISYKDIKLSIARRVIFKIKNTMISS